jgi:hypothetical protein
VPWRRSSRAVHCCSSSLGRRPRLVHRGNEGPVGGAPKSQMVRWRRRGKTGGAHLQPLRTATTSTGRRSSTPAARSWRRQRESEGGGELGGGAGVQHEAAAVGRAERGIEGERDRQARDRGWFCFGCHKLIEIKRQSINQLRSHLMPQISRSA